MSDTIEDDADEDGIMRDVHQMQQKQTPKAFDDDDDMDMAIDQEEPQAPPSPPKHKKRHLSRKRSSDDDNDSDNDQDVEESTVAAPKKKQKRSATPKQPKQVARKPREMPDTIEDDDDDSEAVSTQTKANAETNAADTVEDDHMEASAPSPVSPPAPSSSQKRLLVRSKIIIKQLLIYYCRRGGELKTTTTTKRRKSPTITATVKTKVSRLSNSIFQCRKAREWGKKKKKKSCQLNFSVRMHRLTVSRLFAPSLKEFNAETVTSHILLHRAGFIRQVWSLVSEKTLKADLLPHPQSSAGVFNLLPMAVRVLEKLERIIDDELQGIGTRPQFSGAPLPKRANNRMPEDGYAVAHCKRPVAANGTAGRCRARALYRDRSQRHAVCPGTHPRGGGDKRGRQRGQVVPPVASAPLPDRWVPPPLADYS